MITPADGDEDGERRAVVRLQIENERLRQGAAASENGRLALLDRLEELHAANERRMQAEAEAAALAVRVDAAERLASASRAELDLIRGSTSWRVTRPLRWLVTVLRGAGAR